MHNIMAYETLAPQAFSARWVDSMLASAVLPYSKPTLKGVNDMSDACDSALTSAHVAGLFMKGPKPVQPG